MMITIFTLLKWVLLLGGLAALLAGLVFWLAKHINLSAWWPAGRRSEEPLHSVDMNTLETAHFEAAKFKPAAPPAPVSAATVPATAAARPPRFTMPVRPTARPLSLHPPERSPGQPPTADLLAKLRSLDWFQLQKVVALIYEKQGYAVNRTGGVNPDGGIDLFIEKDGVRGAVQCKQWTQWKIQARTVREFVGAMYLEGIEQGVMVIPGGCTPPAQSLADEQRIKILGEADLGRMLEAVEAGADHELLELINDRRKLCPKCDSELVLRSARAHPEQQFWGCSAYPRCDYAQPLTDSERMAETTLTVKAT
jgi:hypothetical protein